MEGKIGEMHRKKLYETHGDFVTDNMTIDLDVLRAFVKDRICCYLNCGLIITIQGSGLDECDTEVLEEVC